MARKALSRPARWMEACARALAVKSKMEELQAELEEALEELKGVQEEYNEWYENMPESLQQGPTGEKLQEIQNLDFDISVELGLDVIDEAEAIDLPRGFGRD